MRSGKADTLPDRCASGGAPLLEARPSGAPPPPGAVPSPALAMWSCCSSGTRRTFIGRLRRLDMRFRCPRSSSPGRAGALRARWDCCDRGASPATAASLPGHHLEQYLSGWPPSPTAGDHRAVVRLRPDTVTYAEAHGGDGLCCRHLPLHRGSAGAALYPLPDEISASRLRCTGTSASAPAPHRARALKQALTARAPRRGQAPPPPSPRRRPAGARQSRKPRPPPPAAAASSARWRSRRPSCR